MEDKTMKIEKEPHNKIKTVGNDGGFIESQTVEANILYEILNTLKELKSYIINVGTSNALK
jgi:hypothetical protein